MATNFAEQMTNLKTEFAELTTKITKHEMATIDNINEMLTTIDNLNTNLSRLILDAQDLDKDANDMNGKWMFQKLIINWWKNYNVFIVDKLTIAFLKDNGWLCSKINVHLSNLIINLDDDCIADLRKTVNYKELSETAKTEYSDSCFINDTLRIVKETEETIHHDLNQETFDQECAKIYRSEYEINKAIIRCKEIRLHLLSKVKKDKEEAAIMKEIALKEQAAAKPASDQVATNAADNNPDKSTEK